MRLNGFVYPAYSKGWHNAEVRIPCFATQASPFPPHIWEAVNQIDFNTNMFGNSEQIYFAILCFPPHILEAGNQIDFITQTCFAIQTNTFANLGPIYFAILCFPLMSEIKLKSNWFQHFFLLAQIHLLWRYNIDTYSPCASHQIYIDGGKDMGQMILKLLYKLNNNYLTPMK